MKNRYEIIDDYVKIFVDRSDGNTYEVLIDLDDFELVDSLNLPLHIWINNGNGKPYARIIDYFHSDISGRYLEKTDYLHKLIIGVEGRGLVDHIDATKTLDNRKSNLRTAQKNENCKNRKSKNVNNKSGYRNVFWSNTDNRWLVRLQINGKAKEFGRFKDVHEAGKFADKMRQEYYGEFAGLS